MAAPLLAECRPISFMVKPNTSGPTAVAARRSFLSSSVPEKKMKESLDRRNLLTGSDGVCPG